MKPQEFAPGAGRPSKVDCIAAIELWTKTRRVADALSVEDLGELDSGARLVAFVRSGLEAMAYWCRQNPRADVTLALFWAIHVLSDNGDGYCDMAMGRLARFLGRERECIYECIHKLARCDLIRIEGDGKSGKPLRLSPIVPHLFTESMQTVWLFDALAPYERGKPGRKPKASKEIPVGSIPTPISKYLSAKIEIPVGAAPTQISLDSPVVEEETNTRRAREDCNGFSLQTKGESKGLQEKQASEPELFGPGEVPVAIGPLPSKDHLERWEEITRRWGRSPAEVLPPRDKPDFKVGQWLKNDVKALGFNMGHEPEVIAAALETTLASMEGKIMEEPEPGSRKGAGAAKAWFFKAFGSNLDAVREREHRSRVAAKTVEAEAEIRINGAQAANQKKLDALDHRIELGNQGAVKRIEAAGADNRNLTGSKAISGSDGRTYIAGDGKRRYHPGLKLVTAYGQLIVVGEHANKLLAELEAKGATFDDVDEAFGKENGKAGDRTRTREEVLKSVRRTVEKAIGKRFEAKTESLCGGEPHPDFKSPWVCLSREFVEGVIAKCPSIAENEHGNYRGVWYHRGAVAKAQLEKYFRKFVERPKFSDDSFSIEYLSEGYGVTLQKQVEDHVEAEMLREHAENVEQAKREAEEARKHEIGIWIDGGELKVSPRFQSQINRQIGKAHAWDRLWAAFDSIRDKLVVFRPEDVSHRIKQLAYSAQNMSEDAMRESLLRKRGAF